MLIGAMTRVFRMCPLIEALERIAKLGFHHVGLLGQHEGRRILRADMTDTDVQVIRKALEQRDLQPLMIWGGGVDPANLQPSLRKIERAADIGAPTLLITGPRSNLNIEAGPAYPDFAPQECERFAEALGILQQHAAECGIHIAMKPHGGPTGHGQGLVQLLSLPGACGVTVYYDPGNVLYYLGYSPEADLPKVLPYVTGICIKDHLGPIGANEFPIPGQGDVDWLEILQTLDQAGFTGPLLIEFISGTGLDEAERALSIARQYLERLLTQAREGMVP